MGTHATWLLCSWSGCRRAPGFAEPARESPDPKLVLELLTKCMQPDREAADEMLMIMGSPEGVPNGAPLDPQHRILPLLTDEKTGQVEAIMQPITDRESLTALMSRVEDLLQCGAASFCCVSFCAAYDASAVAISAAVSAISH